MEGDQAAALASTGWGLLGPRAPGNLCLPPLPTRTACTQRGCCEEIRCT